jgi:hypothetical protein
MLRNVKKVKNLYIITHFVIIAWAYVLKRKTNLCDFDFFGRLAKISFPRNGISENSLKCG